MNFFHPGIHARSRMKGWLGVPFHPLLALSVPTPVESPLSSEVGSLLLMVIIGGRGGEL